MLPKLQKRDSLQGVSLATQIVCICIITLFVALRYIAKYKLKLRFGIEDGMCNMHGQLVDSSNSQASSTLLYCMGRYTATSYAPLSIDCKDSSSIWATVPVH